MNLINGLLMPMVYLYIGAMTAGACMSESRLWTIAEGLKKAITWILTSSLLLFTVYLSVVRVISGAVDGTTVKVAKTAISGVVPVVGGIIAEASENSALGCRHAAKYHRYFWDVSHSSGLRISLFAAWHSIPVVQADSISGRYPGYPRALQAGGWTGGAFGLVLGMTGGCALLLLISVYSSVAAVMP